MESVLSKPRRQILEYIRSIADQLDWESNNTVVKAVLGGTTITANETSITFGPVVFIAEFFCDADRNLIKDIGTQIVDRWIADKVKAMQTPQPRIAVLGNTYRKPTST